MEKLPLCSRLWEIPTTSNVSIFVWKVIRDKIQTRGKLKKRQIKLQAEDYSCALCHGEEETIQHLLFTCPFASTIWNRCYAWLNIKRVQHCDPQKHFTQHDTVYLSRKKNIKWRTTWCAVVYMGSSKLSAIQRRKIGYRAGRKSVLLYIRVGRHFFFLIIILSSKMILNHSIEK